MRGQNERVSDMQENSGEENITLLAKIHSQIFNIISFLDVIIRILSNIYIKIKYYIKDILRIPRRE